MAYSAEILRRAQRQLDSARADRESVYQQRLAEAYRRVPRLKEIDLMLRRSMALAAQAVFTEGGDARAAMEQVKNANLALQEEKRQRLTQDKPYLHMTLPARVKVGEAFEMPRVTKLPEDMKAAVLPDTHYVDVQKRNGAYWFVPKLEGRFAFVIEPASCPGERKSFSMEAYQLHPVTSIRLTTSGQRVMPGDSFTVSASYAPSNADNTARARWVVTSGASCVRMIAPGQFTAASAGRCTITHEVEGVQASVSIDVLPAATGLKLSTHQITVKVNDASRQLGVIVDPPGAQGYSVTYSVKDGSVLHVDPRNGQITPVGEGNTTIDVCLLDSHGMLVRSDSCAVEVLPLHQVVNPDIITIIAIVLVLLEGFFAPSALATVVMIAGIVM